MYVPTVLTTNSSVQCSFKFFMMMCCWLVDVISYSCSKMSSSSSVSRTAPCSSLCHSLLCRTALLSNSCVVFRLYCIVLSPLSFIEIFYAIFQSILLSYSADLCHNPMDNFVVFDVHFEFSNRSRPANFGS